jgi:hypothetical protein
MRKLPQLNLMEAYYPSICLEGLIETMAIHCYDLREES